MNTVLQRLGSCLARYLAKPRASYEQFSILSREQLDQSLAPGDLLLVEGHCDEVLLEAKHFSYFTPRDFDLSPYFEVIKPTIKDNFDYRKILWLEERSNE